MSCLTKKRKYCIFIPWDNNIISRMYLYAYMHMHLYAMSYQKYSIKIVTEKILFATKNVIEKLFHYFAIHLSKFLNWKNFRSQDHPLFQGGSHYMQESSHYMQEMFHIFKVYHTMRMVIL